MPDMSETVIIHGHQWSSKLTLPDNDSLLQCVECKATRIATQDELREIAMAWAMR